MVRILGLDPGSRITGYGVVDAGREGVRYVASGCIRVGNGEMTGRLLEIHRHVAELVVAYRPGEVAIERVFMHRNPDSALKLGQARAAALLGACGGGAAVFEYAPRDLRLALAEASAGRLGSLVDRLLLFCYQYDPATGTYGLAVMRGVRLAGALTALALAWFVAAAVRRERRLAPRAAP